MLRSYSAADFSSSRVLAAKRGRRISVCLPARNEAETIGPLVATIHRELVVAQTVIDELVVVDDDSCDGTAEIADAAGARVVRVANTSPDDDPGGGKGQAMWRGLDATTGDIVVYCDADIRAFDVAFILGLVGPILEYDDISFVKGFYERPLQGRPGEGGRVTELMARPLIALLFEDLAGLSQPLAGECAGRRDVLESVPFVGGYGVDLGLLIDISARFGVASIAQSDLGQRVHRNRTLAELSAQALAILQLGLTRAGHLDRPWPTTLARPDGTSVRVAHSERLPLATVRAARKSA